jgi:hypothetical protein
MCRGFNKVRRYVGSRKRRRRDGASDEIGRRNWDEREPGIGAMGPGGGVFRDESEDLWIMIETRTGTWIKRSKTRIISKTELRK